MSHEKSLFYFWLVTNSLMAISLGIILPWTVISTARTVRYMQNFGARLFLRLATAWLMSIGLSFAFDIITTHFWSSEMLHAFVWLFVALFTMSFSLVCWTQRHAMRSLYPKADFLVEQGKRLQLLEKMLTCDKTMPLPRIESKNGVIIFANRAAQEITGYSLTELHRMSAAQLVHEEDRARVLEFVLSRYPGPYEMKLLTASGRIVHMEVRSTFDPADADIRISFLTDVTKYVELLERRMRDFKATRAEEQRRFDIAEFGQVMAQLPVPVNQ